MRIINAFPRASTVLNLNFIVILYIRPAIVLISICFSEKLDLRFVLEMEGIFPSLKLQGALRLATNGKQIELDPLQDK